MARRFISTDTAIGAVRRYFGLSQDELSWFLAVSKSIIGHIEAGRRSLTSELGLRLLPLTRHLPAPVSSSPTSSAITPTATSGGCW